MLKIKLSRFGKRGQSYYRIVVAEAKSKRDGKYTDLLGTYNPMIKNDQITLDVAKYQDWIKKGAQPTLTVSQLFAKLNK
ncbi:30S ribosomal protein S16 [Candidatus Beckwithbacteria bacterium CG23_combo_of_CG06-09_8_20_14_all_34_8]|uniref:Small ribosomal subunit protein bS16 n=1 Tax=Candidatus Beckwithbacteria bacterium CG23_combo_of_CG06-09_8_20_14_all_34_8 TaxID=1974497 RepID=A0A2H0B5E7_9BACT|nr:MAG: 30S ribosomal protein S16 [Candidatus Beckwithbacteria bacterium CG23_combo_of_CG06-09_8_20_14_all_34_8]